MTAWPATVRRVFAPLIVLAGALLLRIWAFGGVSFAHNADDGRYAAVAQNLSLGHLPEGDAEWFGWRMTFLWPVAALFRVFGASDYTAVIWPLIGSLGAVAAAWLIGRDLGGRTVALLAASLVALAPLEVIMGTRLRPDALLPAFVGLAMWCALRAGQGRDRALWWAVAAGALLGAGWFVRESILVMVPLLVFAGWSGGRRALGAGVGGLAGVAALAAATALVMGRAAWSPLVSAPAETLWRNPLTVISWEDSYLARALRAIGDPGHPLFLLLPICAVVMGLAILQWRGGDRLPALALAWLAWVLLYLEVGTLVNLDKPLRFLTLASLPLAIVLALVLARTPVVIRCVAIGAVLVAALSAAGPLASQEARDQDVVLLNRVAAELADRPPGPVIAESFVWQSKLTTWTASDRLEVSSVVDPILLTLAQRRARRRLDPLPDLASYRGGYVVVAPVRPRRGWPSNWGEFQEEFRQDVPWDELDPVAAVGEANIYYWPVDVPAPG